MLITFPILFFYITTIFAIIFLVVLIVEHRIIKRLRKEIGLHKRIIESKTKSLTSGRKRRVFDKGLILSFDTSGIILSLNDAFLEFLGFTRDDLIGKSIIGTLIPQKDSNGNNMSRIVEHFVSNPKLYIDLETEIVNKNKDKYWVSWTNRAIYDENNKLQSFTCVGFDITSRKTLEKELEEVSSSDIVRGVYNKSTFIDISNKELMRAIRYKRHLSIVVMTVYRNPKYKNSNYDDKFLQNAVSLCKSLIRDCDYIGRIGDNEFALLLPETKEERAKIVISRIKNKIIELDQTEELSFIIDSLGAGEKLDTDESIDSTIIRAFASVSTDISK